MPRPSQHVPAPTSLVPLFAALLLLPGCSSSPAPPPRPALEHRAIDATESALNAFERGELEIARDQFERALTDARRQGDPAQIAPAAQNLAACLIAMGDLPRARDLLAESIAARARTGTSPAAAFLLLAAAERREPNFPAAAAALDALDRLPGLTNDDRILSAITRGLIDCDTLNAPAARRALDTLRSQPPAQSAVLAARMNELNARVLDLESNYQNAALAYEQTALAMRAASLTLDVAPTLLLASAAAERNREPERAAELARQSAQVALGAGDLPLARRAIDRATLLASSTKTRTLTDSIAALNREIDRAQRASP